MFDLFQSSKQADLKQQQLVRIPIHEIQPNPNQPRKTFVQQSIDELAESIRQFGLIQPIVVRRMEGHYELVAGERRLRACKSLSMSVIDAIVQNVYEEDSAYMALIENLQRENLHFLEEAESYQAIINSYGLTQEELAQRLAKNQSTVANKLRILKLSPAVKKMMVESRLTERHARALLRLRDEKTQMEIIDRIRSGNLSVKETEKLVENTLDKLYDEKADGAKPRPRIIRLYKDYRLFLNTIKSSFSHLTDSGMPADMQIDETDECVQIHIRLPKK